MLIVMELETLWFDRYKIFHYIKELLTLEQDKIFSTIFVPFFLTLKNPNRSIEKRVLESTVNAIIIDGECLSDYIETRDELLTFGD